MWEIEIATRFLISDFWVYIVRTNDQWGISHDSFMTRWLLIFDLKVISLKDPIIMTWEENEMPPQTDSPSNSSRTDVDWMSISHDLILKTFRLSWLRISWLVFWATFYLPQMSHFMDSKSFFWAHIVWQMQKTLRI